MADGTATVTIDTGECVYPDEFGVEHRRATVVAGENILFHKRKSGGKTHAILYAARSYSLSRFRALIPASFIFSMTSSNHSKSNSPSDGS